MSSELHKNEPLAMKYRLTPVTTEFAVQTITLSFTGSERSALRVLVDMQVVAERLASRHEPESGYQAAEITFITWAKLEVTHLNFWEAQYDNIETVDAATVEAGFYYVSNSAWDKTMYDPLNRFDLAHFLLIGYDSYLEVLAAKDFQIALRS